MNGTVLAASFSPEGIGGGGRAGAGGAAATDAAGGGTETAMAALPAGGVSFAGLAISILFKYKNAPAPIATTPTTVAASGHIQAGVAVPALVAGFLTRGVA